MNYKLHGRESIVLMSQRKNAPYVDQVLGEGKILIYEGHDQPRVTGGPEPKSIDQVMALRSGKLTQNGLFFEAARRFQNQKREAEIIKVYEKIYDGIWVFNGLFKLTDAWIDKSTQRNVFKFQLELIDPIDDQRPNPSENHTIEHARLIPSHVKIEVWKRDGGRCAKCGSKDNLHFDHILPYSLGGTSLLANNIQLLCARHNLEKSNRIE